jgi:hypothetical protein
VRCVQDVRHYQEPQHRLQKAWYDDFSVLLYSLCLLCFLLYTAFFFSDPPYGILEKQSWLDQRLKPEQWDTLFQQMSLLYLERNRLYVEKKAKAIALQIWCNPFDLGHIMAAANKVGVKGATWGVWVKPGSGTVSTGPKFASAAETWFFGCFGEPGTLKWAFSSLPGERTNVIMMDAASGAKKGEALSASMDTLSGRAAVSHLAHKPASLTTYFLQHFVEKGDLVMSMFAGQGSDIAAAVPMGIDVVAVDSLQAHFDRLCDTATACHGEYIQAENKRMRLAEAARKKILDKEPVEQEEEVGAAVAASQASETSSSSSSQMALEDTKVVVPRRRDPMAPSCTRCEGRKKSAAVSCAYCADSEVCRTHSYVLRTGVKGSDEKSEYLCDQPCFLKRLWSMGGYLYARDASLPVFNDEETGLKWSLSGLSCFRRICRSHDA